MDQGGKDFEDVDLAFVILFSLNDLDSDLFVFGFPPPSVNLTEGSFSQFGIWENEEVVVDFGHFRFVDFEVCHGLKR